MWKTYSSELETAKAFNLQAWALHLQSYEMLKTESAKNRLQRVSRFKQRAVFAGILWVAFMLFLIYHSLQWNKIFFVTAALASAVFTVIAIVAYIRHIRLIRQIDNSGSLMEVQKKTALLQMSTIQIVRILFLPAPFYTILHWSPALIRNGPLPFFCISVPITLLFTFASLWLYRNIHYKNRHKKWFRILFSGREWTDVVKAMQYLEEIETYKLDKI